MVTRSTRTRSVAAALSRGLMIVECTFAFARAPLFDRKFRVRRAQGVGSAVDQAGTRDESAQAASVGVGARGAGGGGGPPL